MSAKVKAFMWVLGGSLFIFAMWTLAGFFSWLSAWRL